MREKLCHELVSALQAVLKLVPNPQILHKALVVLCIILLCRQPLCTSLSFLEFPQIKIQTRTVYECMEKRGQIN